MRAAFATHNLWGCLAAVGWAAMVTACATGGSTLPRHVRGLDMPSDRLDVGDFHGCVISQKGAAVCWGAGNSQSLAGTWPHYGQATPPSGVFRRISAGSFHSCGLTATGTVVCWGAGSQDAHGAVHHNQSVPPAGRFVDISCGEYHSCAVRRDRTVLCWGDNTYGQSTAPPGKFVRIAAGAAHTCGMRPDGMVECWGLANDGQTRAPPVPFEQISAGSAHTCGLQEDGEAVCWGYAKYDSTKPPDRRFVDTSAGGLKACGLDGSGTAYCWGANEPGLVTRSDDKFESLAVGRNNACGVTTAQVPICWGRNDYGQSDAPVIEAELTALERASGDPVAVRIASGEARDGLVGEYTQIDVRDTFDAEGDKRVFNRVGADELFSFMAEGPGEATVRLHRLVDTTASDDQTYNVVMLEDDVLLQHLLVETVKTDRYIIETTSPIKPAVTEPTEYRLKIGPKIIRFDFLVRDAPEGMLFDYEFEPDKALSLDEERNLPSQALTTVVTEVALQRIVVKHGSIGLGARAGLFVPTVGGSLGPAAGIEVLTHLPWLRQTFSLGFQGTLLRHQLKVSAKNSLGLIAPESIIMAVPLVAKIGGRLRFGGAIALYGFAGFGASYVRVQRIAYVTQRASENWLWTTTGGAGVEFTLGPGVIVIEGGFMYAPPTDFGATLQGYTPSGSMFVGGYRLGL